MWEKVAAVIKGTVELNLSYSSKLFNMSAEYLKDVNNMLNEKRPNASSQSDSSPSKDVDDGAKSPKPRTNP